MVVKNNNMLQITQLMTPNHRDPKIVITVVPFICLLQSPNKFLTYCILECHLAIPYVACSAKSVSAFLFFKTISYLPVKR